MVYELKLQNPFFAVNAPVLKPLDRTAIRFKKSVLLKALWAGLNSPPHFISLGDGKVETGGRLGILSL